MSDWELLQKWAEQQTESAFAELVRRHVDLVYASALRQVRDPELARDISQAVFLALARKAGGIGRIVILSGWLFRTTCFIAARSLRTQARRQRYEQEATAMNSLLNNSGDSPERWPEVAPHLDAALAALPTTDRDAVILRYLEHQPLRTVGERFGISEDAAKKRVSRAILKLRDSLAKRGVILAPVALASLLAELPVEAAPVGITADISQVINSSVPASISTMVTRGLNDLLVARFESLAPLAGLVGLLLLTGGVLWERRSYPVSAEVPEVVGIRPLAPQESNNSTQGVPASAEIDAIPTLHKLMLSVRGERDDRPIVADLRVNIWSSDAEYLGHDERTDANGFAEIPFSVAPFGYLNVWISALGFVPVCVRWGAHEFDQPTQSYKVLLEQGQTIRGIVQDERGRPIIGARIKFSGPSLDLRGRQDISYFDRFSSVVSDVNGRFLSDQMPVMKLNRSMDYAVEHDAYVPQIIGFSTTGETFTTNNLIVMKDGFKVRGLVLNADGDPVAGAKVVESLNSIRSPKRAETDPSGAFEIGPFEIGQARLEATVEGFGTASGSFEVGSQATNVVLKLVSSSIAHDESQQSDSVASMVRIIGNVVDADSGQPIKAFRVLLNAYSDPQRQSHTFLGEGKEGRFDWPIRILATNGFNLAIESDGFETCLSDTRPITSGTQSFELPLRRGASASGRVLTPTGEPVSGAFVGLNENRSYWCLKGGKGAVSETGAASIFTDSDGRFSLKSKMGVESVLIEHDLGCTLVPMRDLPNSTIILKPWGVIEGTSTTGGKPAAGQSLRLMGETWQQDRCCLDVEQTVITDSLGRFRFERVPAGVVRVCRLWSSGSDKAAIRGYSHCQRVDVVAGGVTEMTLGGRGRPVVGKLVLSREVPGYKWWSDRQTLKQAHEFDDIDSIPLKTEDEKRRWAARQRYLENVPAFFLHIDDGGNFISEDVEPGMYTLMISLSQPVSPGDTASYLELLNRPRLATKSVSVTIPEGDDNEPVDLGEIFIEVNPEDSLAKPK